MVERMNDSLFYIPMDTQQQIKTDSLQVFNFKTMKEYRRYLKGKKQKRTKQTSQLYFLSFETTKPDSTNYVQITFNDSNLTSYVITVYKKPERNPRKAEEIEFKKFCIENQLLLSFPEMNISDLLLKLEKKEEFSLLSNKVDFYNTTFGDSPYFVHNISQPFQMEKETTYKINLPLINTDKAVLFYKYAVSNKFLEKTKWKAINSIVPNNDFTPTESGAYVFMVVYNWNNPLSFAGNLEILPEKNLADNHP